MIRKFYTLKYPHPSFMADKWDARGIYTQSIETLLQKEALDEQIYHNGVTFRNDKYHAPASEDGFYKSVQEYILESLALDVRFIIDIPEGQTPFVAERAEDIELVAPLFVRFRSGRVATTLGDEGYEILKWEEASPDERDRRIAVATLNQGAEQTEQTRQAEIEAAKAKAQAEELRRSLDKLSGDIAKTVQNGQKAHERLEKASQASCATLREAVEKLSNFCDDPKVRMAGELYSKYKSLRKVAVEMGVSAPTVGKLLDRFEDTTGFSVNRPKPGENFSVKAQTETLRTTGNRKNGKEYRTKDDKF